MEKSKKVICIILIVCALSALCAVGAYAELDVSFSSSVSDDSFSSSVSLPVDDPLPTRKSSSLSTRSGSLYNHATRSEQFSELGWSVDPDYFIYESGTLLCTISGHNYYKSSDGPCIAVIVSNNTSFSQPYLTTPSTGDTTTNKTYTNFYRNSSSTVSGEHSTITIESNDYYVSTGLGYTSGYSSTNIPELPYTSQPRSEIVLSTLLRSGYSALQPEPDPEPSDPSPEGGSLLDGFSWAQNIGYYASFSPLLNSFTLEPSFLGVTRMSRLPYEQITDSKFQAPSSSNGCALIMGQKTDYDDILVSGTVGYGVCAMLVTSSFKLDSSTLGVDYTAQISFASGDDPSDSGYTQVDASTLGLEEYTVRVWSIDYNEWSKIVMCRYYFVLDLGVSTPSFPTDTISVQFKSTAVHTHEWYWTPFDFRFQYALRDSESDPLPDSVTNYNPATGSPTSSGGYNTSGSTVSSDLNEELTWANGELVKLTPAQETVLNAVKFFYDEDGQLFQDITGSLESLYNSLSYTGVGGSLKFPRAVIPWGDRTLMLWPEQTIPFGEYINQIPTIYVTIISFLLVTGGWFAFVAISVKFFKRTFFGDVTSERF